MADWRAENAEHLKGQPLQRRRYWRWSESWDHDHCSGCWAEFAERDEPGIQHEGFTTCEGYRFPPGYEWVCVACYTDLKDEMEWLEVEHVEDVPHEEPSADSA